MLTAFLVPLFLAQSETADIGGGKRLVDNGKVDTGATKAALQKALDAAPNATSGTIIICVGNAPQTPLDKVNGTTDDLGKIFQGLRPKMKRNIVSRAFEADACPSGIKLTTGAFDQRGPTITEVRVISVAGEVSAYTRDGRTVPLFKDSVVPELSEIRTGKNSRVMMLLPDGTQSIVREESRVSLSVLKAGGSGSSQQPSRLKVWAGKLWSAFKGGNHNFEVETQNAVSGVRGTEFQVGASKASTNSTLGVYDGKVAINSTGKNATVPQGYAITAKEALGDVRPLPPPPENLLPRDGRFKQVAHVRWEPVKGASGYRFEMAREVTFTEVFFDQNFVGNKIEVRAAPGRYYWRVFTRDEDDIESEPSQLFPIEFTAGADE